MNREELKALGLTDEQIDKVMAAHGKVVNSTKDKADKVEGLESQLEDYKTQLADRDTQLDDLSKQVKDNADLTAEIDRLKDENKTATADLQKKLETQAFDFALDKALTGAKVKNSKAIRGLLDMDTIKLDGETLKGLDDQLNGLKESDSYLFEQETEPTKPTIVNPGNPNGGTSTGDDDPFAAKLAKYN
ncbi:phage scaffolding protein [Sutcliffiella horikoshii]|uniref:phage scaffolding protein n=1 Tax=Sutcliffiella horikoshii TaxID=79883 RepID=UPI00203A44B6|nr:phage scaffolding protein [Sutcliffiella horikoshii]